MQEKNLRRSDFYIGLALLSALVLAGNYGLRQASAQTGKAAPAFLAAREFRLVDAFGKMRGIIGVERDNSTSLRLLNSAGIVGA